MTSGIIPAHGGYRSLLSYQTATIIYDFTVEFVKLHIDPKSRTKDQMEQAARSGKQNIAEGSTVSGTSKKMEVKLIQVARGSQEELLQDYEDFLRHRSLVLWGKEDPRSKEIRGLSYLSDRTYMIYRSYMQNPETAANCALCLIHQVNYLLDQQIRALEKDFLENGGFTERLYRARTEYKKK
jgi:restriction system protein